MTSTATLPRQSVFDGNAEPIALPNFLTRAAFHFSIFAIPFARLYVPGTGDRFGVMRIVQLLILLAVLSQPRICLRLMPLALVWFGVYCVVRIVWGLWLSPELSSLWWPATWEMLSFSLPWLWLAFNVLQFPKMARAGLWTFVSGCALCAALHIAGIGTGAVAGSEGRTSIFGENVNVTGITYALALIVLIAFGMFRQIQWSQRAVILLFTVLVGIGLAKTGSRTGILVVGIGMSLLLFERRTLAARARKYATLLLSLGVLVSVLFQLPTVMNRFETINPSDRQQEARGRMIPVLWEMFSRHPIKGIGPEQYSFELTRRAMPHLVKEQQTISAHNLGLLLLVETGVMGFLLFMLGLSTAIRAAWRARVRECGILPLALIVPLFLVAMTVSNPLFVPAFWLAIAYALAGEG